MSINKVKRLLSVTGFTALLTLLRMCTGFIVAKVVAVYTGPSGLAMLGQIQNIVNILNGIVTAPVGSAVVRYTAENINKGFEYCTPWWRSSLQWSLVLLAIIIPIGCLISNNLSLWLFNNKEYYWLIIIACCVLPLSVINTLVISIVNGQQQYYKYIILGFASNIINTVMMILLIYNYQIKGALIAAVINGAITGSVMLVVSTFQPWFKLTYWWGKTTSEQRAKIGGYVLMAITSALTIPVSLIVIRKILVIQVGWDITGQWQAVWKISEVYLSVITMSLSTYYLPRLSSLITSKDIRSEINRTAFIVLPIVIILAFLVYLFRDLAINLLFTNEFRDARNLFAIQLCGDVVKILAWLYAYPMLSKGKTKIFVFSEIFFSITFVLLVYILVTYFGIKGACMGYLFNYILYFIFIRCNFSKIIS